MGIRTRLRGGVMSWVSAGRVGVDSGQIMVIDPCYIGSDFDNCDKTWDPAAYSGQLNYQGVSAISLANNFGQASEAVVTSSGYGDGVYPVEVRLNEDNRVVELRIRFE